MASRQEIIEEREKFAMKMFDYAESPIKKWISQCLGKNPEELFADYNDDYDRISIEFNNKYYNMYLSTEKPKKLFDVGMMKDSESIRKAASLLYDSVQNVFTPVITASTIADLNLRKKTMLMAPLLNEAEMNFRIVYINKLDIEIKNYDQQLSGIGFQIKRLSDPTKIKAEGKEKAKELLDKLFKMQADCLAKRNAIDKEELKKIDSECKDFNSEIEAYPRLYMVFEQNNAGDMKLLNNRLPQIGTAYQDPDEETFVDKFKKEFNK
jgi:hypothetical protein